MSIKFLKIFSVIVLAIATAFGALGMSNPQSPFLYTCGNGMFFSGLATATILLAIAKAKGGRKG